MAPAFMQKHEQWLAIASEDLDSAKHLYTVPFMTALFHVQQAAEKSLKSYLVLKTGVAIRTHNLVYLVDRCMQFNKNFESLRLCAAVLTPYEVAGRYPDTSFTPPNNTEIKDLIAQSEYVCNFVKRHL